MIRNNHLPTTDPHMPDLCSIPTRQLLETLFSRYKEAVFIGNDHVTGRPLHLACHMPEQTTGMHSRLVGALQRLVDTICRRYPDVNHNKTSLTGGTAVIATP